MQNYHRHSTYSNISTPDSVVFNEDYAKRAVELGHGIISSVEHGWQGYYFETFELAKKYNLKFVFGAEAYWVKDRKEQDKTNCHIVLLAKNENGRQAINDVLSEANLTGYYYKPRIDRELILSLPPKDIVVTTACVAFWNYEEAFQLANEFRDRFGENFFLEIQYHDTEKQKTLNRKIKEFSKEKNIPLIAGLDSHYISPEQAKDRDNFLESKSMKYEDEAGWYMDYPDDDTVRQRFEKQGVFSPKEVEEAMSRTDICLDFDDYSLNNRIFSTEIKLPSLYDGKHTLNGEPLPKLNAEEKYRKLSQIVTAEYKEYIKKVPKEKRQEYRDGVQSEMNCIRDTGMTDYFLIDYEIVKEAKKNGGILTNTGRGSAASFFTNTLLGFSKVDRFNSPIKLYPERFMSTTRILESHSLPDIDLNWGTPEIAEAAQTKIMGKNHSYPMIAFGTCKTKAAFKLYAKSQNMDFELANEISQQLERYEKAVAEADDDEKDDIDLYEYVDEKYRPYIEASEVFRKIVTDKKRAPCAHLLYDGDIRREIGLIKCKSDSTKKEYITAVIDGAIAENYKFLKNDILTVTVVSLTDKVFKRIGMEMLDTETFKEMIKNDPATWGIYSRGLTMGINQVEKESTSRKVQRYKPKNISEMSAFVAAVRPGFKSMYDTFESRVDFSYGIPALDNILRTKELPQSYMFYQEQVMNVLNYAGFPMDECYSIIKAIAKKHPEKVKPLKERFLENFRKRLMEEEHMTDKGASEAADKVWQIINDNCSYSFNSSHSYCMALDSTYQAWQKAHYPYEFYEVLLQEFSDKGKKDKVMQLKQEMFVGFGIKEGEYRFGVDNRKFLADKENQQIIPSLISLKGMSQSAANALYELSKSEYEDFYDLWKAMKKSRSLDRAKIETLIKIDYFRQFGNIKNLLSYLQMFDYMYERSQFSKEDVSEYYKEYIIKYSKESEKQYREFDYESAIHDIISHSADIPIKWNERLKYELECFGFCKSVRAGTDQDYVFLTDVNSKYKNPEISAYRLCDGKIINARIKRAVYDKYNVLTENNETVNTLQAGKLIKILPQGTKNEPRWVKDRNGEWQKDWDNKQLFLTAFKVLA